MSARILADAFDAGALLRELARVGAASVPCLDEGYRRVLLAAARAQRYTPGRETVGTGARRVYQQLEVAEPLPAKGELVRLRDELQAILAERFAAVHPYPFETGLRLDEVVLQRYPPGSIGITPHRDHRAYVNLVCLVSLGGEGRFYVCADRAGRDPREVDAAPGTAVLLRAPGFRHAGRRPFHAVDRIRGPRYVVGLRQTAGESA